MNGWSIGTMTTTPPPVVTYGGSNGTIHTITADDLSFTSGNLTPGRTFEHTFATAGTYPIIAASTRR